MPIRAEFSSPCADCGQSMKVGQLIETNDAGEWRHYLCPPGPKICQKCHMQKPCDC